MESSSKPIRVFGREGELGTFDPSVQPDDQEQLIIDLKDGQTILVPADLVVKQNDGSLYLPMSMDQFTRVPGQPDAETSMTIPVMVEELSIDRKRVTTGRIRLHKKVHEREEIVDEPGYRENVQIDRVPVNQVVDARPEVRYEGDTMVIPIMEEVLVVEKRLILKEEVRVTQRREEVRNPQRVTLRSEEVEVERIDDPNENSQIRSGGF